jgi:outer membrane lipopolysaccharide assembly protein LptE/RlpB
MRRRLIPAGIVALLWLTTSCGYHTAGNSVRLPSDLHTIYVPGIANSSPAYRVGPTLTEAVIRELRERTNYRIVTVNDGNADAVLTGKIITVYVAPLTYDSVTGRISSSMVMIVLSASLTGKGGNVLWSNGYLVYREQYQESVDVASFFEESTPAVQRIATNFAKNLVANILEAY